MNYRNLGMTTMVIVMPFLLYGQTETFDIVTYQAPANWNKQTTDYTVSYSTIDNAAGTWCQLGIYNSVQSSGNATHDFSSEWKALVKPDTYAGAVEPSPATSQLDGWTYNKGRSNFRWQGKESYVTVLNISGYGVMVSVIASGNSTKYDSDVDAFLRSIHLKKPAQQSQPAGNQQTITTTAAAPITVTGAAGNSGIALSTTNFDDGWVSQPFADYVRVTKQPITVLLHYAIQIDDRMRSIDNMAVAVWDQLIVPRYQVSNAKIFQNEPYTYFKTYFMEADAIESSTNKPCYIALRVLVANGIATPIEIIAPSEAAFKKEFADQAKIEKMVNYNKFAVSPSDILGRWEESSSIGVNMYNVNTGLYAGMNASASASSFEFRTGGAYSSTHKGAYGMTGNMKFYDQKYEGKYTLTNWDVTMTNRFEGKTDIFWCQYEAVRGGRILRFADKNAVSMTYALVKVK